ncbi:MAG: 1-deoxy-D-xylulose-5-phosphate reductoisomerase [Phycisphaerales bacterium]
MSTRSPTPPALCRVLLLGSTGSIGTQTLDVITHLNGLHAKGEHPTRYEVVGLAAGRNARLLGEQAAGFKVREVALLEGGENLHGLCPRLGPGAAERLVREVDAHVVVAAMVGASGLPATLAAVELGRDVALANKETLVAAGTLIVPAARASGSRLLPVDSEHSAVWQCLHAGAPTGPVCPPCVIDHSVKSIVLTASGGPFRTWSRDRAYHATPAQALAHPTWSMGAKVTVDSASLTNKAFEVIEAHWLFGAPGDRIQVLVHPQSVVHSLVEFADGNVIAQLGPPDMRAPIQYALTFPHRAQGRSRRLDWLSLSRLEFEPPDTDRFPALRLAYRAIAEGGTAGAVFSAASEEAVNAFLAGGTDGAAESVIPFGRIPELARDAMDAIPVRPGRSLGDILDAESAARRFVRERLGSTVVRA